MSYSIERTNDSSANNKNSNQTNSSMQAKTAVVFGSTGAIGRHLIDILSSHQPSWNILAVTRSASSSKFDHLHNVKVVQGDPSERKQVLALTKDAKLVYCCIGVAKYERRHWAKHWPIIIDNLLAGSSQSDQQKFIFCDNLYAYALGAEISPTKSALVEASYKSKRCVRATLRRKMQARMDDRPDSITVVGGSDFFGPLVTRASFLGDTFTKAIVVDGTKPIAIGSADVVHDFCYAPDFANALYVASMSPTAYGRFWICPHSIKGKTLNSIASDVVTWSDRGPQTDDDARADNKGAAQGVCKDRKGERLAKDKNRRHDLGAVTVYGKAAVYLLSPFLGFMREMVEMLPMWTQDYTVDDTDFCTAFGVSATPYEDAMRSYIRFYLDQDKVGKL